MEVEGETFKKGNCSCGGGADRDWPATRRREAACAPLVRRRRTVGAFISTHEQIDFFKQKQFSYSSYCGSVSIVCFCFASFCIVYCGVRDNPLLVNSQ